MPAETREKADALGWTRQLAGLLISIAALLLLYWGSVVNLLGVWSTSDAYSFLYLILPISLFFILVRRALLAHIAPRLRLWALIPLIAFAALWLFAHVAFLAAGEHVALVGMLLSLLMLFLGGRVFRALLFPFLLLWMMVPVGDGIMPDLVTLTVFLSKSALVVLGTTTTSDGTILVTGMGRYGVVEACSALPFIVGNLIVTLVFANLNFRRFYKQALLVVISVPVAIFANILRIVAVVFITETSGGEINLVADHITFGWILFAVVVALEILLAVQFADKPVLMAAPAMQEPRFARRQSGKRLVAMSVVLAVGVLATPHAWSAFVLRQPEAGACSPGTLFNEAAGSDWQPDYAASPDYTAQSLVKTQAGPVDIYVAYYRRQAAGHELVGWANNPYDGKAWGLHEVLPAPANLAWDMPPPETLRLHNQVQDRRIVWTWYWVDERFTGDPLTAKLRQAKAVLEGHDPASAALLLSVAENFIPESAEPKLRAALEAMGDPAAFIRRVTGVSCQTPTP